MEKLKSGRIYLEKSYEKFRNDPKIILAHVAVILISFILSYTKFGFDVSPFGIAVCSVAPGEFLFSCFLGQAFGYASSQSAVTASRYVLTSLVTRLVVFRFSKRKSQYKKIWFLAPVCLLCVSFFGGAILSFFIQRQFKAFFAVLSESAVAAVSAYFFSQAFDIFESRDDLASFSPKQYICLVYSAGAFLISLSSFSFYEVSLSRILVGVLILLCAYTGGEIAACAAGVVGGISVGIYTNSSFDIISLSLSGLLSGVFSPLGSVGCVASFLLCRFSTFFFTSPETGLFALFAECAASITLFFALPKDFTLNFQKAVLPAEESSRTFLPKQEVCEKMIKASDCIGEIGESVDKISERLRHLSDSNMKAIYCKLQADVCSKCKRYSYCADKNFHNTYKYFEQISKLFCENERVTKDDLPKKFVSLCTDTDEFLKSFEKHYRRHRELLQQETEVENMRKAFRIRLDCEREMLLKFAKDFSSEKTLDRQTACAVRELMKNYGIRVSSVLCVIDEKGVMSIKAVCKSFDGDVCREKLKRDIEDMTLRKFENPEISYSQNGITFEMKQKAHICVKTGLVKIPVRGDSLCGDNCESFTENGVLSVILSDGMGTGGRAAVDSAMSAEFFKKLIVNGFGEDVALKIVNSSMLVKSSYESLATIDYATIDLFTGKTQICKAGAAATVIRKNGETVSVEDASLPIGILNDIGFSKESFCLSPSDIIVMMSDGATANGTDWIEEEVRNFSRNNAEDLARNIALRALEKSSGSKQDDVTVFAAILE